MTSSRHSGREAADDTHGQENGGPVESELWIEHEGEGPIMATAIHAGHEVRGELLPLLAIDAMTRSREEDAYTDYWARMVPTWLVPTRSRFEVDLNRDPDEAVYVSPEMAWGLELWQRPPGEDAVRRSLEEYEAFYRELERLLDHLTRQFRHVVVLDLHTYNHRRAGPDAEPSDPLDNPDVNVGTGSVDHRVHRAVVDRFIHDLRHFDFLGHHLDVRENVKFKGRHLAAWIHEHYPGSVCVLSVEFKKFFMDEWTGIAEIEQVLAIRRALQSTVPGLLEELRRLDTGPPDAD